MKFKKYYDYSVYEDGRVYSYLSNKFLRSGDHNGYLWYTLSINGKPKQISAHRLVATLFIREPKEGEVVNHIDGNKGNNHYSNLEWCTPKYNNIHAIRTGLRDVSKSNSKRWDNEDFRERTSRKISETAIKNGSQRGENNPKFRYRIEQGDVLLSRQELKEITGKALSTIDTAIKRSANGVTVSWLEDKNIRVVDTKKGVQTIERVS